MEQKLLTQDIKWLIKAMPRPLAASSVQNLQGLGVIKRHLVASDGQILNALGGMPTDSEQYLSVLNLDKNALTLALDMCPETIDVKILQTHLRGLWLGEFVFLDPRQLLPFEPNVRGVLDSALGNLAGIEIKDLGQEIKSWQASEYMGIRTRDNNLEAGAWGNEHVLGQGLGLKNLNWQKYRRALVSRALGTDETEKLLLAIRQNQQLVLKRTRRLSVIQSENPLFSRL